MSPQRSPYDTGPTTEEIEREAAATGKTVAQIAKMWGVPVPEAEAPAPERKSPYDAGGTTEAERIAAGQPANPQPKPKAPSKPKAAQVTELPGPAATSGAIAHAEKLGVDLAAVVPAGDRITKADVTAHAEAVAAAGGGVPSGGLPDEATTATPPDTSTAPPAGAAPTA